MYSRFYDKTSGQILRSRKGVKLLNMDNCMAFLTSTVCMTFLPGVHE